MALQSVRYSRGLSKGTELVTSFTMLQSVAPERRLNPIAEVGVRHQLSPLVVVDAGVGRRFAGLNRATLVTLGATVTAAVRSLVP